MPTKRTILWEHFEKIDFLNISLPKNSCLPYLLNRQYFRENDDILKFVSKIVVWLFNYQHIGQKVDTLRSRKNHSFTLSPKPLTIRPNERYSEITSKKLVFSIFRLKSQYIEITLKNVFLPKKSIFCPIS